MQGRIINSNAGVYKVLLDDNSIINVKARGKLRQTKTVAVNTKSYSKKKEVMTIKNSPKVGDLVIIENDMIDTILPRINEMIRPDIANVDQILLVFAAKEPDFSFYLLDLFICNVLKQNITPVIVITKIDKMSEEELNNLKDEMNYYVNLGYLVYYVNSKLKLGIEEVKNTLRNKITVLSGQTGAGKSTLVNAMIPGFDLQTQEISNALGRGKHTTRQTTLYQYEDCLIGDTPGFSKLDVLDIKKEELANLFIEFKDCNCKFKDCNHMPNILGCGIKDDTSKGIIKKSRYDSFVKMYNQILEVKK